MSLMLLKNLVDHCAWQYMRACPHSARWLLSEEFKFIGFDSCYGFCGDVAAIVGVSEWESLVHCGVSVICVR